MKKLLVVTGSGASIDFGMPSVSEIDELFEKWALEEFALVENTEESLYSWVKKSISKYSRANPNNRINVITNFESILYTIQQLSSLSTDLINHRYNNRLNPFINLKQFPKINCFRGIKEADGSDFHFLHSRLVDKLLDYFRSIVISKKRNGASKVKFLFSSLKKEFELGFISLNYDNVILSCVQNLNTGFHQDTGEFDRNLIYNNSWNFCYHLHGSIHFDQKGGKDTEMHKIFWKKDLDSPFTSNSSGRNTNYTSEGVDHLNSSIITGLGKTNQVLKEPYLSYYSQIDRLVHESDAVMFIGYGFGDLHLNAAFPFIRYDKNKKRKVVIIDFAENDADGIGFRHDEWQFGLFATIPYNGHEMGNGKNLLPQCANYFKKVIL